MSRYLYTGLLYVGLPLIFLRLLWRSRKAPAYRERWKERLGWYSGTGTWQRKSRCVVFHAVSVGEVQAALPLINRLLEDGENLSIAVTTTTPTGSARLLASLAGRVYHIYVPYDLPGAVRRFLRYLRPDVLVMMETELWPNLLHHGRRAGVKVLLANARLSEKSYRGYRRIAGLARRMLGCIDGVAAQSQDDGDRLTRLGTDPAKLRITGSMKFDLEIPLDQVKAGRALKDRLAGGRPVWIAASTREGEDAKVLAAYGQVLQRIPNALLILVPRHPERFERACRLCREQGLRVHRRSEYEPGARKESGGIQVLLGDSMGEMMLYYGAADFAFVGGSLVNTGCQNILEPAALELPVITGPSLFNFQEVSRRLIEAGALRVVEDEDGLARAVIELIENPALHRAMSAAASQVVRDNRGATRETLEMIQATLEGIGPHGGPGKQ